VRRHPPDLVPGDRRVLRRRTARQLDLQLPAELCDQPVPLRGVDPLEGGGDVVAHGIAFCGRGPAREMRPAIVEVERRSSGVAQQVGDVVPPLPELTIHKARGDEQRHGAIEFGKDRCGNARKIRVAVVDSENHRGGLVPPLRVA